METRTFHKPKSNTRMAQLVYSAKNIFRGAATAITSKPQVENLHYLVIAKEDFNKVLELNRDAFRVSKELKLYHMAFINKHEVALCDELQNLLTNIDRRCKCGLAHLDSKNANSNNVS